MMFLMTLKSRGTTDIIMLPADVGERFKSVQLQGISITVGQAKAFMNPCTETRCGLV